MNQPPKKQFVLHHPVPWNETSRIAFEGYEWDDLAQASQSIVGLYGYKLAVEVLGRYFVLTAQETQKIADANIPFTLGFISGVNGRLIKLESNHEHQSEPIRWITAEEGGDI